MQTQDTLLLPAFAHNANKPKRGMLGIDPKVLGILLGVGGGAGGTNAAGDVLTTTVDGRDLNAIWAEFQATLNILNANRTPIVDFLTFGVQNDVESVSQIAGTVDFELASEFGEPKGGRIPGAYFNMGFTLDWYDIAARFTWKFLAMATAAQVEALHQAILEADNRLMFNGVMKTVFNSTNLTANINTIAYTVYKFYNADGTVPPPWKTYTHTGTHTHYLTSGAATVDSGDLDDMYTHLYHHGYGTVESGTRVVLMVNKAQADTIRGFRSVATGGTSTYDFVPAQGSQPFLLPPNVASVQGQRVPETLAGLTVIGSYGPITIVQEDYVPLGYMVMFATGGRANLGNPVGIREPAQPGLRGLRLIKGANNDYPLVDSFYGRAFGTGVRQRGGTVVMQVTASPTYTIPVIYQ